MKQIGRVILVLERDESLVCGSRVDLIKSALIMENMRSALAFGNAKGERSSASLSQKQPVSASIKQQ